eukprot:8863500-Pyramimonas_sp.AAC.1
MAPRMARAARWTSQPNGEKCCRMTWVGTWRSTTGSTLRMSADHQPPMEASKLHTQASFGRRTSSCGRNSSKALKEDSAP